MNSSKVTRSKFLSLVPRHKPETIGLTLDAEGWADVDDLLARAASRGTSMTRPELDDIVATSEKKRFAISEDGRRIRANQGHSIEVDLNLQSIVPPEFLYHGTVEKFLGSMRARGLLKGQRHRVHLSAAHVTAEIVGKRRGQGLDRPTDRLQHGYDLQLPARAVPTGALIDNKPPTNPDTQAKVESLGVSPEQVWVVPGYEPPRFASARLFLAGLP